MWRRTAARETVAARAPNLLELAPVRVAAWREVDERVVLERPRPPLRGLRGPFEWFAYVIAPRRIRLDAIGGFAWQQLEGRRTVGEIAAEVRDRFGEAAEPVEERLGLLVRLMRREGLVAYPGDAARPD